MSAGETGLSDAFSYFLKMINDGEYIDSQIKEVGFFSYLLTKKQKSDISTVCKTNGWVDPRVKAICIDYEYLKHILDQRTGKDGLTYIDCAVILSAAFNTQSRVSVNRKRHENDDEREQQAVVFNAGSAITSGKARSAYGTAIIEINLMGYKAITAYHSRLEKIKALNKGL